MTESIAGLAGLSVASVIAGAINSVAGGGTLVSFPALIAFGVPPVSANATNTAAVCPGSLSSAVAYRHDLPKQRTVLMTLLLPSLIGGLSGAWILAITSDRLFAQIVPFLILFATLLFALRDPFARLLHLGAAGDENVSSLGRAWGFCFQLFVAAYGGYFGAGIGILMLASLAIMGFHDIHRMNAVKTILGFLINGTALIYFIIRGLVVWHIALLMAAGAVVGGYAGARLARRVDQRYLRIFIVTVGLIVSAWLFYRAGVSVPQPQNRL
ncbi:MAG TPA: sulfite exporter TauE/SafE family protein [Acidobacteriota bacterium]|nr:sulfite exporter TauE/SafE family protein [Acidobacteriota bacterium]